MSENAIKKTDLAASVQRYQPAIDEAKVRLNLAVCPGGWLIPERMVINTESMVGYNNQLKQAGAGMKLGINNDVNKDTKTWALPTWKEDRPKWRGQQPAQPDKSAPVQAKK